jgi:hypothetical protein
MKSQWCYHLRASSASIQICDRDHSWSIGTYDDGNDGRGATAVGHELATLIAKASPRIRWADRSSNESLFRRPVL